jgi:Raf kinase inhibitor-like YbhB/YbcL family protein
MKLFSLILTVFFVSCSLSHAKAFKIMSPQLKYGGIIPEVHVFDGFGCEGKNVSPQLDWKGAPKGTKSFALTVYDPDAPTGSGWWHWVVVNIPANFRELPIDFGAQDKFSLNNGILQVRNDFGAYKFGGPCPPKGSKKHRYIFTIHALKVDKLDLDKNATAAFAGFMINQNTIAKANFMSFYKR